MSWKHFFIHSILFAILSYLVIFIGQNYISISNINASNQMIIQEVRLPLYISAILIGLVFSTAGLMMQLIFKNNLATPYTLGISSGAVFFILFFMRLGIDFEFFHLESSLITSILGSFMILFILFRFIKGYGNIFHTILLIGIALNILFSSAMMLLQYYSDSSELYQMTHWLVGSIEIIDSISMLPAIFFWLLFMVFIFKYAPEIDLMSVNTQLAMDRGIDIKKLGKMIIILQALSLGALIPLTGPIAFVGLIVPNVIRLYIHSGVKSLLIYTSFTGANFMLFAHFLSMRVKSGEVIPVGIITAIVGAVFLIYSLIHQYKQGAH